MPTIGAHVSTAGGLWKSVERAEAMGASCMQIFGASPQQWSVRLPAVDDVQRYRGALKSSGIGPVFLHAAYLVNLASPDVALLNKSIKNLTDHLRIADMLGSQGLIFHVGSKKEMPLDKAMNQVAHGMAAVLKAVPGNTQLILENSAGGGQKIGTNPEELAVILKKTKSSRAKLCIDTAHAFEAGVIESYTRKNIATFFDVLKKTGCSEYLVVFHVNDSKTAFNSHHDRHENIGEGLIGRNGFQYLAREKCVQHLPWILEVPGFLGDGPDKKNIDILKACAK